ncbi:EF-hand calcium-binding domain-containing protein 4B [Polyodon spathula]|uniref:EF-hand calcium-binding domain-containing protein 4B n=1 Tax=Polyodon spathula TaxID=7913 RepID=UPI001B7EB7B5|nr:EF-hand calcium-binding domain-containing protein 4B [Polyodon spathula]XP_041110276.1 EF-hand calcium-binding domain-containing protein 4B [Polyodon spathula]
MAALTNTCATKTARNSLLKEEPFSPLCTGDMGCNGTEHLETGQLTMLEKTHEFFQICDVEDKGFITRRDMQRLHGELPLSADELENVFDTLDADGNGFLTLEEFTTGFSEFLFGQKISISEVPQEPVQSQTETVYQNQWEERLAGGENDEERHFCMLMESLGASNLFEDQSEVRSLWAQLRRDEPHLLSNFEEFLARVSYQLQEANKEKKEMESALKRKAITHDDEMQRLYEEMEQQINKEKERILLQDSEKFLSLSQDLELQLSRKEHELDQLVQKQRRLELQCMDLHSKQHETKVQNVKLKQTNEELGKDLERTCQELALAQQQLQHLHEEASRLYEEREIEVYRVTEGLQRERAGLLKQLDLLREMNKHLRDDRDVCFEKPKSSVSNSTWNQRSGSIVGKYTERKPSLKSDDEEDVLSTRRNSDGMNGHCQANKENDYESKMMKKRHLKRIISIEEDHLPQFLDVEYGIQLNEWAEEAEEQEEEEVGQRWQAEAVYTSPAALGTNQHPSEQRDQVSSSGAPSSPRWQPVGKETVAHEEGHIATPDRVFKIVLVGNSSVGKTSLLRRFCDDCFYPGTSATVGIDYSVKTVTVDNSQVALQMWDTAGQERYRSITKQFFRKADGVIVMYDITSELTFTSVRQWLMSVQEGAGDDIPIMLVGNKTDKESEREVQFNSGQRLAKDLDLIFYECSAFSGHSVKESMLQLARILKEREDKEKEKTIQLVDDSSKKKSCCM